MKFIRNSILYICIAAIIAANIGVVGYAAENTQAAQSIILENGSACSIDLVDKDRQEGKVIIYTRKFGDYTKPFSENTNEYVVVNNIIAYRNTKGTNGTYIPSNGYVISYTGEATDFIKSLYISEGLSLTNLYIPSLPDLYFIIDGIAVPIDQINSARGAQQIILYNPAFGESTKTNAWGLELTVEDNAISKVRDIQNVKGVQRDNNSTIPINGMVISVHSGSPYYKQLQASAKERKSITVFTDNIKLYSASKAAYAAYNPHSLADNTAAWDAVNNRAYPGYRGPDQLIIYDSIYGTHTATNPYGYEVAVNSDGKVIRTGGNDISIPVGGYVISGHGEKLKWLQKYATLGTTVIVNKDRKEIILLFTPDSYIDLAMYSIERAQDRYEQAKSQYLDISYGGAQHMIYSAEEKLQRLRILLGRGQYKDLSVIVNDIQQDAEKAYFIAFESSKAENRAVWLRPSKTTVEEIRKQLNQLKSININTLYLETYFNGYSIYSTNNKVMPHNPMYKGLDILDIYIKEAHKRGIEVHAWVENFLVDSVVASKYSGWLAVSRQGQDYFKDNNNVKSYYLNPALPEVRDYISELYKELVIKYEVDGIQFDYMRYPHSGDYTNDFGYDRYTRQLFLDYAGVDPIYLKPGDKLWQSWCEFRTDIVSSFVYRLFSEIKSLKPNIQLSSDVWPEYDKTLIDIYQDPRSWVKRDYINNLVPMSYYLDEISVVKDIDKTLAFTKGHSQLTVGIATLTGVDKQVLIRQVDAIRASDTNGLGIFEFNSIFNGGYDSALKLGVFSSPAATTNKDPEKSVETILGDMIRKIDKIYYLQGAMKLEQAEKYKKLICTINTDFVDENAKADRSEQVKNSLEDLLNTIENDETLNGEVAKRMETDISKSVNIIDCYISSTRFASKQ